VKSRELVDAERENARALRHQVLAALLQNVFQMRSVAAKHKLKMKKSSEEERSVLQLDCPSVKKANCKRSFPGFSQ